MKTTYVQVDIPSWVRPEQLRRAAELLSFTMKQLGNSEKAMRGFLLCAAQDGFPVQVIGAKKEQLQELCIRAFWFSFERITKKGGRDA